MSDGRAARGPLYDLVRERLGARRDLEIAAWAQAELDLGRSRFAALAQLVHRAAELGDAQADHVFTRAAQQLAELVAATRHALMISAEAPVPVSYSGGVFGIGARVTGPFTKALQATGLPFDLRAPRFAPVIGAALYAAKCSGRPLPLAALDRLATQSAARPQAD
jgi:N-acetylglucosamine kinase-like BadF-type ATPase